MYGRSEDKYLNTKKPATLGSGASSCCGLYRKMRLPTERKRKLEIMRCPLGGVCCLASVFHRNQVGTGRSAPSYRLRFGNWLLCRLLIHPPQRTIYQLAHLVAWRANIVGGRLSVSIHRIDGQRTDQTKAVQKDLTVVHEFPLLITTRPNEQSSFIYNIIIKPFCQYKVPYFGFIG